MRSPARLLAVLVLGLPACSREVDTAPAVATFVAFQDALQRHDVEACRRTITTESAAALAEMPWERVREQKPLQVRGARAHDGAFRVDVVDPNANGRPGEFVVVREYGKLVVDLVASAGLCAEAVEASSDRPQTEELVPRELTPADFDRIRRYELAQPPRK